jgi:ATP-binding protein involved in chromosome partitioning
MSTLVRTGGAAVSAPAFCPEGKGIDMALTREAVTKVLAGIAVPGGGNLISRDLVRALSVEEGMIRFVIETADAGEARALAPVEAAAKAALAALPGVTGVQVVMTAHGPAPKAPPAGAPPQLKIGGHATPQQGGPQKIAGVDRIVAIASGKGGVGKSTVASNLAVALARQGRRVGLLDADIHGPSQPRMMGVVAAPGLARWQDHPAHCRPWREIDVDGTFAARGRGGDLARARC